MTAIERFWQKVVVNKDGCWGWTGCVAPGGYGRLWLQGKTVRANRFAYLFLKGAIPDGLVVMHTCDNPPCCNPAHLVLGTDQENITDAIRKGRRGKRTHCKNGHLFTPDNTKIGKQKDGRYDCRQCRTCIRAYRKRPQILAYRAAWARQRRREGKPY